MKNLQVNQEFIKEKGRTGLLSVDKPYLNCIPKFEYDSEYCKRTAYQMIKDRASGYGNIAALNFYGSKTSTRDLFKSIGDTSKAYTKIGVKKNDNVSFFALNTPEMVESLYSLNQLGAITEWFNPTAISPSLLRNHIEENDIKYLFTIDVMYDVVKEAIKGTNVEKVVVNSVMDSFSNKMNLLYRLKTFGLDYLANTDNVKIIMEQISKNTDDERDLNGKTKEQLVSELNFLKRLCFHIGDYAIKDKTRLKTSFYKDHDRDERFITWRSFLEEGDKISRIDEVGYEEDKTAMVIHTGGTTGPVKRVAVTDYAINSAPYQISLMPNTFEVGDSLCQITPPIVAWSLEAIHAARYFNMTSNLIATYDRKEFPGIVVKCKDNHYFTVPSFVKTLIDAKEIEGRDLSFIKTIFHGGEGIAIEDDKRIDETLKKHNCSIRNALGFGQNEEFSGFLINLDIPGVDKVYGTCGIPLAGNDYIIYDLEKKCEVPYGKDENGNNQIGELLLSGPSVMQGYIGRDAVLNEKTILYINGKKYIDTGDQAYADSDGRMWYYTREQRIIRTQDGKIFVNILEDILNSREEIEECCVVKSPHPSKVSEASCHIVLKEKYRKMPLEEQEKVVEDIILEVEDKTSKMYSYYVPGTYEIRNNSLPLTSFGKVAYRELEQENEKEYESRGGKPLMKVRYNK